MPRKLTKLLVPVAALGCFVVGSTIAWPNHARPVGGPSIVAAVDFDQAFANATATRPRENKLPVPTKVGSDRVLTDAAAMPPREGRRIVAKVDFDQVFSDAAIMHRANTPPNREKLRDAGWTRILGPR
jgi:hypothetical protein